MNDLGPNPKLGEIWAPSDIKWQSYTSLKSVTPYYDHDIGVFTPIKKKRRYIAAATALFIFYFFAVAQQEN